MHASFAIVGFQEHLGPDEQSPNFNAAGTTFAGDESSVQSFAVPGRPQGRGYLLVQAAGIGATSNKIQIFINGQNLDPDPNDEELVATPGARTFQVGMAEFGSGVLQHGTNTLQFRRIPGATEFVIYNVVINWMEEDLPLLRVNPSEFGGGAAG